MMIRGALSSLLALALTGCVAAQAQPSPRMGGSPPALRETTEELSSPIDGMVVAKPKPTWRGHEADHDHDRLLAARAHGALDVYATPGPGDPLVTLEASTILGTPTVLGVVGEPSNGWIQVMLPLRPNGTTGWIREDRVWLYVVDGRIVVDLSERQLWYYVDGVEVLSSEVGVGSRYNETPTGEFFVTDRVTLANPNSPWGPHALGLSARSDTITSYNGGDGIIGIHGTNNPGSVGGNISLGCVRLPNEAITALYQMVPLGTRVEVRA